MNYYNEIDPGAAAWLRELIADGQIPAGEVDERSIWDVRPGDLRGFTQCHFFAGIGGWALALKLAGFPADREVWTGSCPCQPFSSAGKGAGVTDERHLWPAWFHLIRECRPDLIFGEQVSAAIGHGWLDLVQDDLAGEGYACGPIVLPACSVGAPHIRQRLWFVAHRSGAGLEIEREQPARDQCQAIERSGETGELADSISSERGRRSDDGSLFTNGTQGERDEGASQSERDSGSVIMADSLHPGRPERGAESGNGPVARSGESFILADSARERCRESGGEHSGRSEERASQRGETYWSNAVWLPCRDGKSRPTQSSPERLAARLSDSLGLVRDENGQGFVSPLIQKAKARVIRLKGYGNSIVPQVAAEVIKAWVSIERDASSEEGK